MLKHACWALCLLRQSCYLFRDRVKVELGLGIGDGIVSLFRGNDALLSLTDDDVVSFVMGNNASYFFGGYPVIMPGFQADGIDDNVRLYQCFLFNEERLPLLFSNSCTPKNWKFPSIAIYF